MLSFTPYLTYNKVGKDSVVSRYSVLRLLSIFETLRVAIGTQHHVMSYQCQEFTYSTEWKSNPHPSCLQSDTSPHNERKSCLSYTRFTTTFYLEITIFFSHESKNYLCYIEKIYKRH